MSYEFLRKEYELCFEQLRFYDTRHFDLLKYLVTLTSSVTVAQFAIYKFMGSPTQGFFACQTFLSCIVFVASVLIYLAMLQNRLYFVFIARQLNAIRKFSLETESPNFKNNQLYTSTDFPAIKPASVHTFQLLGVILISSLFAATSAYSVFPAFAKSPCLWFSIMVCAMVAGVEIVSGYKYLASSGIKQADEVIHGKQDMQEVK